MPITPATVYYKSNNQNKNNYNDKSMKLTWRRYYTYEEKKKRIVK